MEHDGFTSACKAAPFHTWWRHMCTYTISKSGIFMYLFLNEDYNEGLWVFINV